MQSVEKREQREGRNAGLLSMQIEDSPWANQSRQGWHETLLDHLGGPGLAEPGETSDLRNLKLMCLCITRFVVTWYRSSVKEHTAFVSLR